MNQLGDFLRDFNKDRKAGKFEPRPGEEPVFEPPTPTEDSRRMQCGFEPGEPIPTLDQFGVGLQTTEKGRVVASRMLRAVERWLKPDAKPFLLLAGTTGIGKSHLVKAAIWTSHQRGSGGYYITAYEFDRRVKDFKRQADDEARGVYIDPDVWVERLAKVPRLAVDDVGAGYFDRGGYTLTRFERLFDMRYRLDLPTVVTTNLGGGDFGDAVGPRVMSRLRDMLKGEIVDASAAEDMRPRLTSRKAGAR